MSEQLREALVQCMMPLEALRISECERPADSFLAPSIRQAILAGLWEGTKALAEPDVCAWRSVAMFYVTSCGKKLDQKAWDDLRNAGFTFPCCPGCGKRIEVRE